MRIKELELCYENCELVTIPGEYLIAVNFSDHKKTFARRASNSFSFSESYDSISIVIASEINSKKYIGQYFGDKNIIEEYGNESCTDYLHKRTDITQITLHLEDGSKHHFFVPWSEEYEYDNYYQKNYINSNNDVAITIFKNEIPDYFEEFMLDFNSSKGLEHTKKILNIGTPIELKVSTASLKERISQLEENLNELKKQATQEKYSQADWENWAKYTAITLMMRFEQLARERDENSYVFWEDELEEELESSIYSLAQISEFELDRDRALNDWTNCVDVSEGYWRKLKFSTYFGDDILFSSVNSQIAENAKADLEKIEKDKKFEDRN